MGNTSGKDSFFSKEFMEISQRIMEDPSARTTVKNGIACAKEICTACKKDYLALTHEDALWYANFLSGKNAYSTSIRKFRNLSALSAHLGKIGRQEPPAVTMDAFFQVFEKRTAKQFHGQENLINRTFGQLKVIGHAGKNERNEYLYECECACGGKRTATGFLLVYGEVTDCGDATKHPHGADLLGQTFGFLKVIQRDTSEKNGQAKWFVRCGLCGKVTSISARNLLYGNTIACGCLRGKNREYIDMLLEDKKKYAVFW